MKKIKKNIFIVFFSLFVVLMISGCNKNKCVPHIDENNDGCCEKCTEQFMKICNHKWIEATCEEAKKCTECGKTEGVSKGHEIVVDVGYAATCTKEGLTSGVHCLKCNKVLIEQKVISSFNHEIVVDEGYEASCTKEGLTEGSHCKVCQEVILEQKSILMENHNWLESTCSNAKICTICGTIGDLPIDHTIVIDEGYEATCEEEGLSYGAHCSVCNKVLVEQAEIEALGHTEVTDEGYEATCETDGLTEGQHCSVCNKVLKEQVILPSKNHNWIDATYTDPKTCSICGKTEGLKLECTEHVDYNNDKLCDKCNAIIKTYKPKWTPNQQTGGWYGNGMTVKIFVDDKSNYDPFEPNYNKSDKLILQKQIRNIEQAYGIDLVYENWSEYAAYGPSRIQYIKTNDFMEEEAYIIQIDSTWIETLVRAGCLAELGTLNIDNDAISGIFTEIGYQETYEGSGEYVEGTYLQDRTANQLSSVFNKVYGYANGNVRPDYFMYYNADMIAEAGMDDPAELWFKGEWTWSNFELYCQKLQTALSDGQYALSVGFPEFIIGSTASTGSKIATTRPSLGLTSTAVIERFQAIQGLYASGCYEKRNVEDVSAGFLEKNVAIVHGDLWFMGDASRFDPAVCDFVIGTVPYPTADYDRGYVETTFDENEAIKGYDGEPIKDVNGDYISGIDMSETNFLIPCCGTSECFSIIDTVNGKNGINNKIIFAILYDLYEGLGDDPEKAKVDSDTTYRNWLLTKFDKELYADVIMSVQDCTYYELIEKVSITVGGGSHFGPNGFWPIAATICKDASINPSIKLNEVLEEYKLAMKYMGYTL